MARTFTATTEYLAKATAPVTAAPLTLAAWVYPLDITTLQVVMSLQDDGGSSADAFVLRLNGNAAGDKAVAYAFENGTSGNTGSSSAGAFVANSWQHVAGVYTSATERLVYLGGVAGTADTSSRTPGAIVKTLIGIWSRSAGTNGANTRIAFAAIWNAALTSQEILSLSNGAHPTHVRPASLVSCVDIVGASPEIDLVDATTYTLNGSPAKIDNPRIVRKRPRLVLMPTAAAGGIAIPVLTRQYRERTG